MKAIIEQGSQQYTVSQGDRIVIDRIQEEKGAKISLPKVLAIIQESGSIFGKPTVDGAAVEATVISHGRGKKVRVFKYKPKKRYRVSSGQRANQTTLTIDSIQAPAGQ